MNKISVGILGATGVVGLQYLQLLKDHPWFEVVFLASSEKSAGKLLEKALIDKGFSTEGIDKKHLEQTVHLLSEKEVCKKKCQLVFSALTTEAAKNYEELYASFGLAVFSNASFHRKTEDVPILIPEINSEHLDILPFQQKKRGWDKGFIVVKPNCSIQSYMIPLHCLHEKFKISKLMISTLQAISGAGYPGLSSLEIQDNVIPYIEGEEVKSEWEPLKVWGVINQNKIEISKGIQLSVSCHRVPVLDGHMASVSVEFKEKPRVDEILSIWQDYQSLPQQMNLPTAPLKTIYYQKENNRPQPRLDRLKDKGMAITVGRLRECPIFDFRFVGLSHNTIRGAAGGGILNAELLYKLGYIS